MQYGTQGLLVSALVAAAGPADAQSLTGRVVEIAWPAMGASTPPPGLSLLAIIEEADKSYLPVLIPRAMLSLKTLKLVADDYAYTASGQLNGATISITGSRIAFGTGSDAEVPTQEMISRDDDRSVDVTRVINGASYTLRIECEYSQKERPKEDRCADDRYLRAKAETLDLVGGNRGTPPPRAASAEEMSPPAYPTTEANKFAWPPGKLNPEKSGKGVTETTIFAPSIRFPLRKRPAYLNSQVYGFGGTENPAPKGWADPRNYEYPWYDNYCEVRSRATALCPSGKGHQGVDIRPETRHALRYEAVAVEAGKIHRIGTYSISLLGDSGTEYRYLHLGMADVRRRLWLGKRVNRGEVIGLVSNDFGATKTTVHLHFEIWKNLNGRGSQPVPPYSSLVRAYVALP